MMTQLKFEQRLAAVVPPLRRLASEPLTIRVRERLLQGGQFRTANVYGGSYWILRTIEHRPFDHSEIERPLTGATVSSRTRPHAVLVQCLPSGF